MPMKPELQRAGELMKTHFGYSEFRPAQSDLIGALLDKRDVLGIMPTGAGKSMCYQLPAIMFPGITLVVSPLISLMQDQVRALIAAGIRGAYLNSSLTFPQYLKALDNAKNGVYKIIYVAPERLCTAEFLDFARNAPISMVAIDEAHCVSQWGHDFRPSYLQIKRFVAELPSVPVLAAFTATATESVKKDIMAQLGLRDPLVRITGFDRENLFFDVKRPEDKKAALLQFIRSHEDECGIVYCSTRKNVEKVTELLIEEGFSAGKYHAGLSDDERRETQNAFIYEKLKIIVATNAFGMGIDKQNVRYVLHYNMPKNMESYYQEAGRAGRDGANADCLLLFSYSDVYTAKFLIEKATEQSGERQERVLAQKQIEQEKLERMIEYCTAGTCLRQSILGYFGEELQSPCGNCGACKSKQRIFQALSNGIHGNNTKKERTLYEMLRRVRSDFSEKTGLPPDLIFTDRTLQAMSVQKPETEYDMLQIPGVSPVKYQKYGKVFLRVIQRNRHRNSGV